MSRPSIIVHCELKIFLWVQSAKVSPLTRLGLFFLLQGSQGWKLPVSQRGALKPCWHRRGGRSLLSCELYGLKSGCQSAVIAQWDWAPPLGQSASERAAINKLSTLSPKAVRLEPQGAHSLNSPPQTLSITFFPPPSLVHVCRILLAILSHILDPVISLKAISSLHPAFIWPARARLCPRPYQAYMNRHPVFLAYRIFWGIQNDVIQIKPPPGSPRYCECD